MQGQTGRIILSMTMDRRIIELQNIGLPRHLSKFILEKHINCLEYDDNQLINIDIVRLKEEMDRGKPEYKEMLSVLF